MPIQIADYDPHWRTLAAQAINELTTAVPETFTCIEHIGSTSVPGLAAKPVIDLMAGVPNVDAVAEPLHLALPALGYRSADTCMPGRLFYLRDQLGQRTHHLHVVPDATLPTRNEILLRDYLRQRPQEAARYGALKQDLATRGTDGEAYTRAKTELIQHLVDAARTERGLPLCPVWEE